MTKKSLFLTVPLAAGIIMTGCSAEEVQDDNDMLEEENLNEPAGTEENVTLADPEGTGEGMMDEDSENSGNDADTDYKEDTANEEES
ncbi:hypothetical protein FZC84_07460 [Rossellomorea vietnamensis]|uniref:Uncharacterized protein n=2 Tax=Bacillaceae TaxID=186817 RepID=A0A5D4MEP7_9BACI|nr:hypothetical protein [Rossellomorea vietnamensis]TYS00370.1 hypothetical protein FZC84_07460 [Rossellomorea vietnamensis]